MSKKIIAIVCVCLLLISSIAIFNIVKIRKQKKEVDKYLEYVKSTNIDHNINTPEYMHVVLAAYRGEAKGISVLKSIEYLSDTIVPEINKNCGNKISSWFYYSNHSRQLKQEICVNNFKEFYEICKKCKSIKNRDFLESSTFDADSVKRTNQGVDCVLYLKYSDSEEISFNITVLNTIPNNRGFIIVR